MTEDSNKASVILAFSVHLLTASGLIVGFLSLLAIENGDFRMAMIWLLAAFLIDSIDGTFARAFDTKKLLPGIDGKSIDYVVDFVNYAFVPAYFVYKAALMPVGFEFVGAAIVLFVSALYYGIDMVTDDYHFRGFPVMWNMVVFHLFFIFEANPWVNLILVVALALLHFLPVKFAYPSRATKWSKLTIVMSVVVFCSSAFAVWLYPETPLFLKILSTIALGYFALLAGVTTFSGKTEEGSAT